MSETDYYQQSLCRPCGCDLPREGPVPSHRDGCPYICPECKIDTTLHPHHPTCSKGLLTVALPDLVEGVDPGENAVRLAKKCQERKP